MVLAAAVFGLFVVILAILLLTREYKFCEKCSQRRWHKITLGQSHDSHRQIRYDTESCKCMTCGRFKWSRQFNGQSTAHRLN